jgi:hypothetical protein
MKDYSRQIYQELVEQTEKAERLGSENKELRRKIKLREAELSHMQQKMETLAQTMEARIMAAVDQAVNKAVEPLQATIRKQAVEIDRLKSVINKDSGNSSKPPSSDGFQKRPNSRERSARKAGGQAGHKGHRLTIPANLRELVETGLARHEITYGSEITGAYVSDWEIDWVCIPIFREHRRATGKPPMVRYGRNLQTHCVYLQNLGMMSLERIAQYIHESTSGVIKLTEGAIDTFTKTAAAGIHPEAYITDLLNGQVLHTDETPVRTTQRLNDGACILETSENTTYNAYVRVYSNATTTLLTANAHKNDEGIKRDGILERFCGILSHDHDAKLYKYTDEHATCCEHLSRELKGMEELCRLEWAGMTRRFFLEMNKQKKADIAAGHAACAPPLLERYEKTYDELIRQGESHVKSKNKKELGYDGLRKMVARLTAHKDSYLRFIRDYSAPFTNNQAERDLRHVKIRQKVSGCYRSWQGLLDYCSIRSLTGTVLKRGLLAMPAISACFLPSPAEL